ncbi:Uncharacterised protein [Bordetella pertussis]|nr:Uncharacterised protein [Bordetella pertussis]
MRSITPGRKPSINPSAAPTSSSSRSLAPGARRSSASERRPRASTSKRLSSKGKSPFLCAAWTRTTSAP